MPAATTRKALAAQLRAEADRIRLQAEARMESLYGAANVLDAEDPTEEATPTLPTEEEPEANDGKLSVVEMILEAARTFGKAVILTNEMLRDRATEKHPEDREKIKSGIYNAVVRLVKREEIHRVPGGFQLGKKEIPAL